MGNRGVEVRKFPHQFPSWESLRPPFLPEHCASSLTSSSIRPVLHPQQICPRKSFKSTWLWHKCQGGSWPCANGVIYNVDLMTQTSCSAIFSECSHNTLRNIKDNDLTKDAGPEGISVRFKNGACFLIRTAPILLRKLSWIEPARPPMYSLNPHHFRWVLPKPTGSHPLHSFALSFHLLQNYFCRGFWCTVMKSVFFFKKKSTLQVWIYSLALTSHKDGRKTR